MDFNTTGVCDCWVLVHNNVNVLLKLKHEGQETQSIHTIEMFQTEEDMNDKILQLDLIEISEEEEEF